MHFLTTQRPFSFIVFLNAKTIWNSLTIQWPALWVQHFMLDALWKMKTFELMQFLLDNIFLSTFSLFHLKIKVWKKIVVLRAMCNFKDDCFEFWAPFPA